MSYSTFADKPELHFGDPADPAQMNAAFDGLQAEFEDRSQATWLDGVVAGLACSINGSAVDIAQGQAYVAGLLFTGGASVDFTGAASGDYWVYLDSADLADPYKKSTSQPGGGKLLLCQVRWDGTSLSDLVDLRPWGLQPARLCFSVAGALSAGTVAYAVLDRNFWIEDVRIMLADTGSAGTTTVDVHVGDAGAEPATLFSDQARRPSLDSSAAAYSVAASGAPDTNRHATAGQVVRVDVDSAATDAAGLAVVIRGRCC
ncbi:MAG: hypothetical protein J7M26_06195 [Armatimonadetes bacterium]|nr:hypothetical protein [Armatimonadota bacterium]